MKRLVMALSFLLAPAFTDKVCRQFIWREGGHDRSARFSAAETDDSRYFLAGADLLSAYGRADQVMAALMPALLLSH